jgi:ABC-2 type transport system permease protein
MSATAAPAREPASPAGGSTPAGRPPTSGFLRSGAGYAFLALLTRDMRVVVKNLRQFVLRTVMQPLLFTFVFAYVFPKTGQIIGGGHPGAGPGGLNFATILVPGLVAVAVFFQGIQAVALPLTQEFSYTREIDDRVLAPLPIWAVGVGKIVAGAVQGLLAALVVFPIVLVVHAKGEGPHIHVANVLTMIVVLILCCLLGATFGLFVGTSVEPRQVPLVFALIVLPATLLGCIYYPWSTLSHIRWLQIAVLINPLVYMSEAFRTALTPSVHHMPPVAFYGAILGAIVVFGTLALRKFHQRVVS